MRSATLPGIARTAAVAAAAFGIAFAAAPAASADAARLTISPAAGLSDGAAVTATVSGFGAGESVLVLECAQPEPGLNVCNAAEPVRLTADGNGNASGRATARRTFTGVRLDGSVWGTVDCKTASGGCGFAASNAAQSAHAQAAISFS
ncbi:enediyne antibiotic chromoprotein [Allokutzneria albata]|uniref:Neocarzinostatin family protein n=1 Tax=Allokutzneria albata TaxID=211114 RepID=A0A1G9SN10_ALLAB|nr:enediyne antibiotic chromoprotein [Allokutzneria albata]SDM36838.1 Neocarzinostatin family protein [Allokutzneria albata]